MEAKISDHTFEIAWQWEKMQSIFPRCEAVFQSSSPIRPLQRQTPELTFPLFVPRKLTRTEPGKEDRSPME